MKADFEKGTKVCSRCKKELPISEYSKNKAFTDGLSNYCKKCRRKIYKNTDTEYSRKDAHLVGQW